MNLNKIQQDLIGYILKLLTKKQLIEYIKTNSDNLFDSIHEIKNSLKPFINAMSAIKRNKITKKEESLLKKQNREQQKEKKMEKKQSEEEDYLNEEQFKVSRERANKTMDKLRLRGQQRFMRQQREQQEREEYIKQQKARYNIEKQLKVLSQQRINLIKEQKQKESEKIQIDKKIFPITEKVEQNYKKQKIQINQRAEFKHSVTKINGIDNHKIGLEIQKENEKDYNSIISYNYDRILYVLINIQREQNLPFKVKVYLVVEVSEPGPDNQIYYSTHPITTDYVSVNDLKSQLAQILHKFEQQIQIKLEQLGNSNLKLERILYAQVDAFQYQQQGVGSYIRIEGLLQNKKCCINIQNEDEQCAIYCFLYFYYTKVLNNIFKHFHRTNNYKFNYNEKEGMLNVDEINKTEINKSFHIGKVKFPANVDDITKIAKGFNFTYSLFEHEVIQRNGREIIQIRVVENQRQQQDKPHIDLLMINEEQEEKLNTHLVYIKNLNSLLHQPDRKAISYYCRNCLNYFLAKDKLVQHEKYCYDKESPSTDEYPIQGTTIKFEEYHKQQILPFLIVADTESIIQMIEKKKIDQELAQDIDVQKFKKRNKKEKKENTKKLAKHIMTSYGFYIYDRYDLLDRHYFEYVQKEENENVAMHFINNIYLVTNQLNRIIKETNVPCEITQEILRMRDQATDCYICKKPFQDGQQKLIDHCHLSGSFRGIAHNSCNLHHHLQKSKIPCIMHNLRGYDSHPIISNIAEYMKLKNLDMKIDIIANNSEKYQSITWGNARFIDSIQFMPDSLQTLAGNLSIDQKQITMKYLVENYQSKLTQQEIEGILVKGNFPYTYFDSISKLDDKQLPPREAFFNDLTNEELSEEEYNQSVELFNKLGFKSFREWLLLYQQVNVLLLSDVWINFRDNCLKNFNLDPGHFYSAPGLSWTAMLKITGVEIELISDPEMYMVFEKQSRGGISTTGNVRYAKANNKYCPDYDETKDDKYLLYVDANNLYGESLCQALPYKNFQFIEETQIQNYGEFFIRNYMNGEKGYVYDVDLLYPEELHDSHNNYPLAPEQLNITSDMLSKYNKDVLETLQTNNDIKIIMGNTRKLTPNLMNKKNYVCNIRNLQFYIQQGLKIQKINRIIQFDQKDFMRPYIELNTQLRQRAKNDFEKDFFKLLNNSVFGKTCENLRKRANFELISNEKRMQRIVNSRYFKNYIKISENLALVEKHKKIVKLNKPAYIGMQVLDLSKITMYNYYYNHLMKQNYKQLDLIMTDTDSLFLSITTHKGEDLYDNMIKNSKLYDFSNVAHEVKDGEIVKQSDLYNKIQAHCEANQIDLNQFIKKNARVIGKMKNEVPNDHIIEAVSIKSKCYDFITTANKCHKKLKGVKKYVVKKEIKHQDYIDCVKEQKVKKVEQKSLRSYNHVVHTISQEKLALHAFNDKRYILQNGIDTFSYGHFKIGQEFN